MPDPPAGCDKVRSVAFSFASVAGAALLAVEVVVVVVALVDRSVVAGAEDNAIDGIVPLVQALVVASPKGAKACVLTAELIVNAKIEATIRAAISVSGSVFFTGVVRGVVLAFRL